MRALAGAIGCQQRCSLPIQKRLTLLPNLPILGQDETLYSWCAHVHAVNGFGNPLSTSRQLFEAPYAALCHDFPSRLARLAARCPETRFDVEDLALRHTLLGYFLPLQPASAASHLLSEVIQGSLPSIKMRLGITASRVGGHHPLKGCQGCVREEMDTTGFAYWRVEHQFPSVMACTKHARPLFIAWDPVTPVHRRGWLLPVGGLPWERIEVPVRDDRQLEQLIRLGEFSAHFAASQPAAFDPHRLARCYQRGLRNQGLATASGALRIRNLVREMRQRYRGIEDIAGFEALNSVTADWPGLVGAVARGSPRHAHPLKHLLMMALVYDTWENFLRSYEAAEPPTDTESDESGSVSERDRIAERLAKLVVNERLSVSAAAGVLRISVTTATQIARRAGIDFTPRRKVLKGLQLERANQLLRRGLPTRQVAQMCGLSVVSINRALAANLDLKQVWQTAAFLAKRRIARKAFLSAAKHCRQATIKDLRRIRGSNYMWLYRHDRDWLRTSIPSLWSK